MEFGCVVLVSQSDALILLSLCIIEGAERLGFDRGPPARPLEAPWSGLEVCHRVAYDGVCWFFSTFKAARTCL
jgi:hypothetical protein